MPRWAYELEKRLTAFTNEQLNRSLRAVKAAHKRRGCQINRITLDIYKEAYQSRGITMPK